MTRDQLLAELSRAVRTAFPDRAYTIMREVERRVLEPGALPVCGFFSGIGIPGDCTRGLDALHKRIADTEESGPLKDDKLEAHRHFSTTGVLLCQAVFRSGAQCAVPANHRIHREPGFWHRFVPPVEDDGYRAGTNDPDAIPPRTQCVYCGETYQAHLLPNEECPTRRESVFSRDLRG